MARIRLIDISKYFEVSAGKVKESRAHAIVREKRDARSERVVDSAKVAALDHFNLEIPDGLTYAVVGPSGCGKTTLLRIVAGLDQDYSGQVYYDDTLMDRVRPQDRRIGMVFQNFALYPQWKGEGNLRFFFRVHHVDEAETRERIRATSEIMGIGFEELLGRMPRTLSAGQKQRVAIGRAIVREPRLFLFDEPLSNLDAELRARSRVEIRRLLTRFHVTALYVTHDQREATILGDRIVVMRDGRLEQVGAYADLAERPANTFVASFLGPRPMNLFAGGTAVSGIARFGELAIPLPKNLRSLVVEGQSLTAGVRPEVARIREGAQSSPDTIRIRGTVELIEPDFARREQSIQVHTGNYTYFGVCPQDLPLRLKEEVDVAFPADAFIFFDGANGKRIG
jgi:ABC-type sugar transport system ATPase subunit